MHRTADFGIAAHWRYKEDAKSADELDRAPHLVPAGARAAARREDARRVPRVPQARSVSGRDLRLHARRATSSSCRRARRRSTSRSRCTPRSGCTARARRSTDASRRCRARCATRRRSRSSPSPTAQADAATGWRTCARAARVTRSGRWLRARGAASSTKLGQDILERELKRRRLAEAGRRRARHARRARSNLTDATHLLASIGQGDVNVLHALKHLYPGLDEKPKRPKPNARRAARRSGARHRRACASRASTG